MQPSAFGTNRKPFCREALHHQTAAPKLIDPTTLVNREVSDLLSGGALWHLKVAGCFPKMPRGI